MVLRYKTKIFSRASAAKIKFVMGKESRYNVIDTTGNFKKVWLVKLALTFADATKHVF